MPSPSASVRRCVGGVEAHWLPPALDLHGAGIPGASRGVSRPKGHQFWPADLFTAHVRFDNPVGPACPEQGVPGRTKGSGSGSFASFLVGASIHRPSSHTGGSGVRMAVSNGERAWNGSHGMTDAGTIITLEAIQAGFL